MSRKDDIYKKDSVPRFARSKYKQSRYGSVDRHPDVASNSKRSTAYGNQGGSRFEGRMQGQSRSRSGRSGKSGSRRSRTPEGNKTNLVIVGILLFAFAVYAAILGYVKMKGRVSIPSVAAQPKTDPATSAGTGTAPPVATPPPAAPQTLPEVAASRTLVTDKPISQLISDLRKAYNEIKAVDTPLNTDPPEKTIARLEKQLVVTPNLIDLKTELARRYLANEQYTEAAQQLGAILSAEPHNLSARDMLAEAYLNGSDYENAIVVANWILQEDKFSTDARNILATCYMKTGKFSQAIHHLRALANENSLDVVTQNNLGVAHSKMKQFNLAIPIFEKTIRIDKANAVGYYNLAICKAQVNKPQEACEVIYKASEQFGPSFVAQWITSKQFDPIADTAPFQRLKSRFAVYITNPTADDGLMKPGEARPEVTPGKAGLPEFNLGE